MKLLLILLLIPAAFADSPPACGELGKILQNYEVDLQRKSIKNCSSVNVQDIVRDATVGSTDLITKHMCSDLATIEAELERLKAEDAVLSGIEKLKATIQTSQAGTSNPSLPAAQESGKTFVTSLTAAQSLELLVQSTTQSGSSFLQELKILPIDKRRSSSDFKAAVKEICKTKLANEGVIDACDPLFNPDDGAVEEINALVDQATDISAQIPQWKNQLAIKRVNGKPEDGGYSFTQMRSEMEGAFAKLDRKEKLSREELRVIQNLDQFENASGLAVVDHLSKVKQHKPQFAVDRFRFLVEDSIQRQKHEVQSKTSTFWAGIDQTKLSAIPESDKAICDQAKASYDQALACQYIMKEKVDPSLRMSKQYNEFLDAMTASTNYINKLYGISDECLEKAKGSVAESCLNDFTIDQAKLKEQVLQLHLLKEKIGQENEDMMKYRNFALQKFGSQKCYMEASNIEFCDPETDEMISPQANLLTDQLMSISVMYRESLDKEANEKQLADTAQKVENLCNDDQKLKKSSEERLCAFFNDTTSNVVMPIDHEKEDVDGPVTVESRPSTVVRDAWIQGATNILNDVTNYYRGRQAAAMAMNPYTYNYNPYNSGAGPRGIADTILFNARAYGAYGFYTPTPGYKPYTAFGSSLSLSPYSGLKSTPSAYFGR